MITATNEPAKVKRTPTKGRRHVESRVIVTLNRKHDCHVSAEPVYIEQGRSRLTVLAVPAKTVQLLTGKDRNGNPLQIFDLGNKSRGKIDFLTRHAGYTVMQTNEIIRRR